MHCICRMAYRLDKWLEKFINFLIIVFMLYFVLVLVNSNAKYTAFMSSNICNQPLVICIHDDQ